MKRTVMIAAGLLLSLGFSACTPANENNPPIDVSAYEASGFSYVEADDKPYAYNCVDASGDLQYDRGNIYFFGGLPGESNTALMKLNPSVGLFTTVCPLPLCEHNTPECPMFGHTSWFYAYDDTIYYKRSYSYSYRNPDGSIRSTVELHDSVCYDTVEEKLKVLETYDSQSSVEFLNQLFTEDYRFYYDYVYDEEMEQYLFKLCRLDRNSGEISVLGGDFSVEEGVDRFAFSKDERIYFVDGKRLYSRNFDNTDEVVHCSGQFGGKVLTDGDGIYFELSQEGKKSIYYMPDINDYHSAKKIVDDCTQWALTEHYVYYVDGEERTIGKSNLTGYQGEEVVLLGKTIRRCSHNGENDEKIFTFDGDYQTYQFNSMLVVDHYIYGFYHYYEDSDQDGIFQDGDQRSSNRSGDSSIMRIDVEDGSVYFIRGDMDAAV